MKYYDPMHWNINHVISQEKEEMEDIFINRTNNPLERFNRTFGEVLGHQPNMVIYIKVGIYLTKLILQLLSNQTYL